LILCILNTSCLGSFKLTQKLYNWNNSLGDKWINNIVFWVFLILPVYDAVLFLDTVIFNLIEFWGGSNPISMNDGDEEIQIVKSGDKEYMIKATKNKFHIEQIKGPDKGEWADIIFHPEENSCYLYTGGEEIKLVEYVCSEDGNDHVKLFLPNGSVITTDANQHNMDLFRAALHKDSYFMAEKD
jgi:hypothetical protein